MMSAREGGDRLAAAPLREQTVAERVPIEGIVGLACERVPDQRFSLGLAAFVLGDDRAQMKRTGRRFSLGQRLGAGAVARLVLGDSLVEAHATPANWRVCRRV